MAPNSHHKAHTPIVSLFEQLVEHVGPPLIEVSVVLVLFDRHVGQVAVGLVESLPLFLVRKTSVHKGAIGREQPQ